MSTLQTRTRIWFCRRRRDLLRCLYGPTGSLTPAFHQTVSSIGFPNSSLGYLHDVALEAAAIEAAGFEREPRFLGNMLRPESVTPGRRPPVGGTLGVVTGASSSCAAMLYDARIARVS